MVTLLRFWGRNFFLFLYFFLLRYSRIIQRYYKIEEFEIKVKHIHLADKCILLHNLCSPCSLWSTYVVLKFVGVPQFKPMD